MFSAEQYRALREGVGLLVRGDRGQLFLRGKDGAAFLQGLLTNDIAALTPGTGCYAAMLTAQGRMIADMRVLALDDSILLDVDAGQAGALRERFDQMIFSEDAQVEDVSAATRELGVYGPEAARILAQVLEAAIPGVAPLDMLPLHASRRVETSWGTVTVVRSDDMGVDGFDLFAAAASADALADSLRKSGAVDVSAGTAEVTRIEAGRPRFLVDMAEDTIPLEAGIEDRAISLTKGCYVGQEIIIRVLHRGHGRVAKRLVGLSLGTGAPVPARGDRIRSAERVIGRVTSAVFSPALGRPIALGYVHRDFSEPSSPVTVDVDASAQPAVVTATPFAADLSASPR